MAVRIIYFVHGTTTDNEQDVATGWLPGKLSDKGRQQSVELGRTIANQSFDAIFCSDLARAIESASLMFGTATRIVQDDRLRECNYGDLNGQPAALFKHSLDDYIDEPFPNGESYRDVETRISAFLDMVRLKHDDQHIAVVAHQAPQLALDVLITGRSWQQAIAEDWRLSKAWQPGWEYELA